MFPLKNLAAIGSGITLNQDRAAKGNGCRYLTVAHVQRGSISNDDPRYLELTVEERKTRLLESGDVLVVEGHASSMEIGRAAVFEDQGSQTSRITLRVRAHQESNPPEVLAAHLELLPFNAAGMRSVIRVAEHNQSPESPKRPG